MLVGWYLVQRVHLCLERVPALGTLDCHGPPADVATDNIRSSAATDGDRRELEREGLEVLACTAWPSACGPRWVCTDGQRMLLLEELCVRETLLSVIL